MNKEDLKELQKKMPKLPKLCKKYNYECSNCGYKWVSYNEPKHNYDNCKKCLCSNIICKEDDK